MNRLKLDDRIIRTLEAALNAKHKYTSVSVTFKGGKQSIDTLYTAPSYNTGKHFLDGSCADMTLDDVLAIAQSFEDRGDVKTLIKSVEKEKRETLKSLNSYKKRAKELDKHLASLMEIDCETE